MDFQMCPPLRKRASPATRNTTGTGYWPGTPALLVARIHDASVAALRSPDVAERLVQDGAEIVANSPQELAVFIRSEIDKYAAVIRKRKLRAH